MGIRPLVVVGLLGSVLDVGLGPKRWEKWRPTVALSRHADLPVARLVLLHEPRNADLADTVCADIGAVSPGTTVERVAFHLDDPWDFEEVYSRLLDFAKAYPWRPEHEDYLVHITTGSHVAQICLFLLTETRHFPGKLLQTSPPKTTPRPPRGISDRRPRGASERKPRVLDPGSYRVIDLDLSRYDRIAQRRSAEVDEAKSFLKSGIATRNAAFNRMIEEIEAVCIRSRAPLLLTGPTGAGKSQLAGRIYELKKARRQITGELVDVNCATLRGDGAMSALFGHVRGAFTGAVSDRPGLLAKANGGLLFLDEIGELGLDEQAMLLRAVEERTFLPVGSDRERKSDFQLICGTNRDLLREVRAGRFREDLLSRIDTWAFRLPPLRDRPEDIEPNLDYELERAEQVVGGRVTMSREARARFLELGASPRAAWRGNFRDLDAAVVRMATLAEGGRITTDVVDAEIARLFRAWEGEGGAGEEGRIDLVARALGDRAAGVDRFDRVQLEDVLAVCLASSSLSEAGRTLFAASRARKSSANDADRLRKYLARFGLDFAELRRVRRAPE
jgi:transcriptional regulatory protein RtcR